MPLNFLDHHLRHGNSLLSASPRELGHSPTATAQQRQEPPVFAKGELPNAIAALIRENVGIEQAASTEMKLVKLKEQRWKAVRDKFKPFLDCADIWLAAYDCRSTNSTTDCSFARPLLLATLTTRRKPRSRNCAIRWLATSPRNARR